MTTIRRRRGLSAATASVLALLALSACGESRADESGDAAPRVAEGCEEVPEDADATGTRTVTDTLLGDVEEVPARPQRVIALWRVGAELADLCVVPVGQLEAELLEEEVDPDTWDSYADVPVVGSWDGVDVEKVIAAEPDLILGMDNGGLTIDYEELSEVAPTVILDIAEPTDVWDNYPRVAEIMGKEVDFDEKNAAVDAQLAEIEAEHGDVLGDLEVTSLGYAEALWVDTSKSLTWRRLDAAGFGYNPEYTADPERYVTELATENLADLADQDIIFFEATPEGDPVPGMDDIVESESFQRLPAVQAGNVFPLATGTAYTFAAAQDQVDDLRDAAESYEPAE